jgi:hypothetical protein
MSRTEHNLPAVTTDKSSLVYRRQGVRDKSSNRETLTYTVRPAFNAARGDNWKDGLRLWLLLPR